MIHKAIGALTASILLVANANAASLSIYGPIQITVGETFEVQIVGDFSGEGLIAGGISFLYDTEFVRLDDVVLNLPVIPDFSCPGSPTCPDGTPGSEPIVWGEFLRDLIAPTDPAPTLMATLTFTAITSGAERLDIFSMVDSPFTGGWFGTGFIQIPTPIFNDFKMVPLPGAAWLMIGGLVSLTGFCRRQFRGSEAGQSR